MADEEAGNTLETKVVLLGQSGVGKTCIAQRFVRNEFSDVQISTSGASFLRHTIKVNDKYIKYQLWDTAGQEKFRSLTAMYYRGAGVVIMVYDVTCESSLEDVKFWASQLEENGVTDAYKVIVGNKTDMQRVVTTEEAKALADQLGCGYMECSAKTGDGVLELFEHVGEQRLSNVVKNDAVVKPNSATPEKTGCC